MRHITRTFNPLTSACKSRPGIKRTDMSDDKTSLAMRKLMSSFEKSRMPLSISQTTKAIILIGKMSASPCYMPLPVSTHSSWRATPMMRRLTIGTATVPSITSPESSGAYWKKILINTEKCSGN